MAVTRVEKQAELDALESGFKGSESAILLDYRGLNVPQVTDLRRQLRVAKARYKVVKNTLAARAVEGTMLIGAKAHFTGPLPVVIGYDVFERDFGA